MSRRESSSSVSDQFSSVHNASRSSTMILENMARTLKQDYFLEFSEEQRENWDRQLLFGSQEIAKNIKRAENAEEIISRLGKRDSLEPEKGIKEIKAELVASMKMYDPDDSEVVKKIRLIIEVSLFI